MNAEQLTNKLMHYADVLENTFRDMVDFEFVFEKNNIYILDCMAPRRTKEARVQIIIDLFVEEKISIFDVFSRMDFYELSELLDEEVVIEHCDSQLLGCGMPASNGIGTGLVCLEEDIARELIEKHEPFILVVSELDRGLKDVVASNCCKGVITYRGGITSHAAVICRGLGKPAIVSFLDHDIFKGILDEEVTLDGATGNVYLGFAKTERKYSKSQVIQRLRELLELSIKNNIVTDETIPLIWRLWNVVVLHKRYIKKYQKQQSNKHAVFKPGYNYVSFKQPSSDEIRKICNGLDQIKNMEIMGEDLIDFLVSQLYERVSIGCHYRFLRPLVDPLNTVKKGFENTTSCKCCYYATQLTGIEFFNINRYVDYLIDIRSIKIYFSTKVYYNDDKELFSKLNFLDFTNSRGESVVINSFDLTGFSLYINDVKIPVDKVMLIYHLLRRRRYHWNWLEDNNISHREIKEYLLSGIYKDIRDTKLYYLCEEKNLLDKGKLTAVGAALIGEDEMTTTKGIDYILNEIEQRGIDDHESEANDYAVLMQRSEFKDLIALEIYDIYFWKDRHEFDLQLLREILEQICNYFSDPQIQLEIRNGLLQNIPTALIIALISSINIKLNSIRSKNKKKQEDKSAWGQIEANIRKIEAEFSSHDYILTDEIEHIFDASRETIIPLLKIVGSTCYVDGKRSIWIKAGLSRQRIQEILKEHSIKYKKR